jgi:hypothetical protein
MLTHLRLWLLLLLATTVGVPAVIAADANPRLAMFNDQTNPRGRWEFEILESSDPETRQNLKTMGRMSVCMDAASEMARSSSTRSKTASGQDDCAQTIRRNTPTLAEVETRCPDGRVTVMTLTRESKQRILFESVESGGKAPTQSMKGRYLYQGACSADDSVMQFDRNSEACRQMRAQMATMNPDTVCAQMPADQKKDCIARTKASLEDAARMCQ